MKQVVFFLDIPTPCFSLKKNIVSLLLSSWPHKIIAVLHLKKILAADQRHTTNHYQDGTWGNYHL